MNIKNILQESGLTIREFAASVYVSERTVYNWLNGGDIPRQKEKQIRDTYGQGELPANQGQVDPD